MSDEDQSVVPSYAELLMQDLGAERVARSRARLASFGLEHFGDERTALKVGDRAPDFSLNDAFGGQHTLAEILQAGAVVVVFYRGGWCPYCNVYLRALQMSRSQLRALKANLVLISPQIEVHARTTAETLALQFPVLVDAGNQVARQYGLVFQIDTALREAMLAGGTDLSEENGDDQWELPMPATFVVDRHGTIQYAFVSAEYTHRAEPAEVLSALKRLR